MFSIGKHLLKIKFMIFNIHINKILNRILQLQCATQQKLISFCIDG